MAGAKSDFPTARANQSVMGARWGKGWPILWAVCFFLIEIFSGTSSTAYLCVGLGILMLVLTIVLRDWYHVWRLNGQFLAVTLYVLLAGASCFYAHSGHLALTEFGRLLPAFFVYLLILQFAGEGERGGRCAAIALSSVAAVFSFLSIDMVSTRWLSGLFQRFTGLFTMDYLIFNGLEAGTRITSVLEDPNVFAGVAGIGVLLSLSLALSAEGKRERAFHLCCLVMNALAFVLVFSVGAVCFIAVAFVTFLMFQGKGNRLSAAVLMAETLLVTMLGVVAVYLSVFNGSKAFSLVPLLSCVFCCAALWALDKWASPCILVLLSVRPRALVGVLAGLALALVIYAAAAMNVTGSASLVPGEMLERAADLPAGDYTCAVEASDGAQVQVVTKNENDLIMHTETVLYVGAVNAVAFTVPEDSEIIWFRFSAPEGGELSAVSYSGGMEGSLKLGYKLLPGFIANRLQGLWANQNAVQRTQFWRDGLKLWRHSPVLGNGLGSIETQLYSVADFFYQSKYVHNHYIQCLVDFGAVGLALFLWILGASAQLFYQGGKKAVRGRLLPGLGASLVFIALQALYQVDLSTHSFLPFAFGLFALLNVSGAEPDPVLPEVEEPVPQAETPQYTRKAKGKKARERNFPIEASVPAVPVPTRASARAGMRWGAAALGAVWSVLLILNLYAAWYVPHGDGVVFTRMERAMRIDPLNRTSYLLSYIVYAADAENTQVQQKAADFAAELAEKQQSNSDPCYPAEYYFLKGKTEAAVDALVKHVIYNRVRSTAWQYALTTLQNNDDGSPEFRAQALRVADALDAWNAQALEQIELSEENQTYLAALH